MDDDNSFYFLTLQGDGAETIAFKALNTRTNEVTPLVETVQFVPNQMLGAFPEPYRFTFAGADQASIETGGWSVSPNPFSDRLTVRFSKPLQDHEVTFSDVTGRIVGKYHVPSGVPQKEFTSELSNMPSGVYILTVQGSTEYHTVKLIRN